MKIFKKLIRDRIPEIIEHDGKKAITRILDEKEFVGALERKLLEEVQEMRGLENREHKKEEIADIYEVLDALIVASGFPKDEIMSLQAKKHKDRGGFEKRLFLEGVK